ncbi:ribonuclease H2 subunit A [Ceratobasidium sp. AG-I]|nr:ribonuclease H2 subunit A [Ceratobasidium sp. AG-I]
MSDSDSEIPPSLPTPHAPLLKSYTYHSPKPTITGRYVLGVDEAGRGPVLGPLVYGVAYCPLEYLDTLKTMGFADSKTLNHATRAALLKSLMSDPSNLAWSVRVLAPQDISASMLRHPPTNLNQQSQAATVSLIRDVIASGIDLAEIYVDALGPSVPYQKYLSELFPTAQITVCPKADSIYAIVSAASIAAKVTRDAWIENWMFAEPGEWATAMGSGYPSDPNTKAWLKAICEPTFGFPSIVRFSWGTSKTALENNGHAVTWTDENQASLVKAFGSAKGLDKGRPAFAKELGIHSVSEL